MAVPSRGADRRLKITNVRAALLSALRDHTKRRSRTARRLWCKQLLYVSVPHPVRRAGMREHLLSGANLPYSHRVQLMVDGQKKPCACLDCLAICVRRFGGHLRQRVDVDDEVEMVVAVQERCWRRPATIARLLPACWRRPLTWGSYPPAGVPSVVAGVTGGCLSCPVAPARGAACGASRPMRRTGLTVARFRLPCRCEPGT
jgi:hypothetical protein